MFFSLKDTLNPKHPLYILANQVQWDIFEKAFKGLYCPDNGRPAKPIRLMVGLLILKHIRNLSDESVVCQWSENIYYQYFTGETSFVPGVPCEPSELVHFRTRIGESGAELILKESIRINGKDALDPDVNIDTTVQEKNITYPTDAKLHRKIIQKCKDIAQKEGIELRQSYSWVLKQLSRDQRFRNHPRNKAKAKKADKKVKTIAGRLVRELERKLPPTSPYQSDLALFSQILSQEKDSKHKIYSLHEPEVARISKGKEHKKYEFGNKASFAKTDSGVLVGALGFRDEYDGHTLKPTLEQVVRLTGKTPQKAKVDRGYRGNKKIGETEILIPSTPCKTMSYYQKRKLSQRHKKRAGIEPIIGHLKTDHRLNRNFYKGIVGDNINIMLAAAAFNFKRMMNKWKIYFCQGLNKAILSFFKKFTANSYLIFSNKMLKLTF
ncbi:MAG TPA: IS5 family transposase [Bacteroidales bacterium]|nr:IS5 family transposase [Bacteroidales bacterium]